MKVWILMGYENYEGGYIIAVYDSREKAEAAKLVYTAKDIIGFDYLGIVEKEVQ